MPGSPTLGLVGRSLGGFVIKEQIELARALAGGDHAVPELATFFAGSGGARLGGLVELGRPFRAASGDETIRRQVAEAMPLLGAVLAQLDWLAARRLLVPRIDVAEEWRGTLRREVAAIGGPAGQPLLSGSGEPLPLWPVLQAAAPAGGGRDEVFLLQGTSRGSALLVALPGGYERRDDEARAWLVERFGDVAPAERTAWEGQPYLGLAPFTAREAGRFFGREREIEACRNRLRAAPLLVVVGPSGAGKSSFVHAGLAAALPDGWRTVALRPGAAPLAALAAKLGRALDVADASALAAELAEDPASAGAFIAAAGGPPTLIVVDQLEELFTLGADAAARAAFAEALAAAADGEGPMRVVCTLRDDFLVRAGALPGLGPRLARAVHLLGTPGPDELLRIVREPARLAGYDFDDPELPAEMVRDVAGRPAALALLSFTAARLWDARDAGAHRLRRAAYVEMGGVGGALGRHAEATLARLPDRDRHLVREAFRHLVTAEGTRARRPRAELAGVLGGGGVIDALIDARLLVTDEDDVVEVAHEALLAAWPRAVTWRREDTEGARVRDELRDLAQRWDARKRAPALLLRGDELDEARRWQERTAAKLPATDRAFLDASLAAAARGRRIRRTAAFVVTIALAALAVVYFTLYDRARVQTGLAASRLAEVETERDALVLGQARSAVDRDPTAALAWLKLYVKTGRDWPAAQAIAVDAWSRGAARRVLRGHENAVWTVAWSPDGKSLASGSFDRTLRLWDLAAGSSRVFAGHEGEVNGAAFSADAATLVSASDDGTVRAWKLAGGPARVVARHRGVAAGVAAFAAGRRIVSGGSDGVIRVVDLENGAETLVGDGRAGAIQKLALSPDGSTVATVGDGAAIWLWPVAGRAPRKLEGHERRATGVAFAPDGRRLASADIEGNVRLWEGTSSRILGAHRGMVRALAFSPDGKLLATGGYDETVSIWDLAGGRRILFGHRGPVYGVAFSPDGTQLASGGLDGQVRIWDTPPAGHLFAGFRAGQGDGLAFAPDGGAVAYTAGTGVRIGRQGEGAVVELAGADQAQRSVAYAPDGAHVAAVDEAGTVRVWDVMGGPAAATAGANAGESGLELSGDEVFYPVGRTVVAWGWATGSRRVLAGPTDVPRTLRALPDRQIAAIAGDELWLWAADGSARTLGDGASLLVSLVVAPDGRTLATGDHANVVEFWDTARGPGPVLRGHTASVDPLAFSADGKLLVSGSYDKTVRVWPLRGGEPRVLTGHRTIVRRVAVAPDGAFVVSSGNDDFIRTWDLGDGAAGAFAAHEGAVQGMALSPDGRWLASAGPDGTVRLWETARRDHIPAAGAALTSWLNASTSATVDDLR